MTTNFETMLESIKYLMEQYEDEIWLDLDNIDGLLYEIFGTVSYNSQLKSAVLALIEQYTIPDDTVYVDFSGYNQSSFTRPAPEENTHQFAEQWSSLTPYLYSSLSEFTYLASHGEGSPGGAGEPPQAGSTPERHRFVRVKKVVFPLLVMLGVITAGKVATTTLNSGLPENDPAREVVEVVVDTAEEATLTIAGAMGLISFESRPRKKDDSQGIRPDEDGT